MIRAATTDIAGTYEHFVVNTAISFEETPRHASEMARRITDAVAWVVHEHDASVVGYAYAGQFHSRPANRWSAKVSTYLDAVHHRGGLDGRLLDTILNILRDFGYINAFAGIALPNEASLRLFESRRFRRAALYESVGVKHGSWRDVRWWQLRLREPETPPAAIAH